LVSSVKSEWGVFRKFLWYISFDNLFWDHFSFPRKNEFLFVVVFKLAKGSD
jgi:hypothetical protein